MDTREVRVEVVCSGGPQQGSLVALLATALDRFLSQHPQLVDLPDDLRIYPDVPDNRSGHPK